MRTRFMTVSVLIILSILMPTDAYTNHNLEWGVESGVKYHFSGHLYQTTDREKDGEIDEEIDLRVNYYGMIEAGYPLDVRENVSELHHVWGFDVPYLENGTRTTRFPFYILPIGNWSFLTILLPRLIGWFGGESSESEFIDNESVWGFRYEELGSELGVHGHIVHLEMLKEDGLLWYIYEQSIRPNSVTNITRESRRIEPGLFSTEDIMIFGSIIGGLVVAIVVLATISRRRTA